ncbi:hypothetical protein Psed_5903 [Pseudonocardia dioxanivorans CB1190]|uniref:Intracellular septation protein A n=1 Tax=Pseudonocardia dioxanivorans (strain ATCC 55486 / DSM 44775 / JCM 13855 / CB1190) TaxID=675635 RepID=F4D1W7_PSEUX|nr:VC0807 family protein [Pseudonocardia dioxanivorans]AEA28027.1 hypothetical protein Psed_5903 [Pseudonocardia dioxanivorans CB1190]
MTSPTSSPTATTTRHPGGPTESDRTGAVRRALRSPTILLGVLGPLVSYEVLTTMGVAPLPALAYGTAFPFAGIVIEFVRRRRLDVVNAMSLAAIVVGLAGGLVFDSARFLLIKDSIITATVGLAFLGSVAVGRPLLLLVTRRLRGPAVDALWAADHGFRRYLRTLTLVWGAACVLEATLRIGLAWVLEPGTQMVVGTALSLAVFGATAAWTLRRRTARLGAGPADLPATVTTTATATGGTR